MNNFIDLLKKVKVVEYFEGKYLFLSLRLGNKFWEVCLGVKKKASRRDISESVFCFVFKSGKCLVQKVPIRGKKWGVLVPVITGLGDMDIISEDIADPGKPIAIIGQFWLLRSGRVSSEVCWFCFEGGVLFGADGCPVVASNVGDVVGFLQNVRVRKK
jgi:hypothetical protein